ncbi:MAG: hypothetical protein IAG13_13495 [Deltaproteobacteria bacterium]|nr:hypothetical protein [Nannocystaceae bacterium]
MADPKPAAPKPAPAKPTAAAKPAAAAVKPGTAIAVTEGEPPAKEGRIAWILGWVVLPATVLGGIFGGGVILGAHDHEGWFARSVMWVAGLFG